MSKKQAALADYELKQIFEDLEKARGREKSMTDALQVTSFPEIYDTEAKRS